MFRRWLIVVAGLASALAAGCGTLMTSIEKDEPFWLLHRHDWTVYQPSHRVALATLETLQSELAEVELTDAILSQDDSFDAAKGKRPKPGEVRIPEEYPAFWLDGYNPTGPVIVNCRRCDFEGKTKDGRRVDAVVRIEIAGSDQRTVVSLQVGRKGDPKVTEEWIKKISERLHRPSTRPGSPEERAALNAAFAPKPDADVKIEKN